MSGCTNNQQEVYSNLSKSVFEVRAETLLGTAVGTAFVVNVNSKRISLTAGHVCDSSNDGIMHAYKFNEIDNLSLKILKVNNNLDLCALEAPDLIGLNLNKTNLNAYQEIYSMGYPFATALTPREGNLVAALIDPFSNPNIPVKVEETTIMASHGDSGSPVVTNDNKLVGVITAANTKSEKSIMVTKTNIISFLLTLNEK